MVIWVKNVTELMVEIYFKSLIRATAKVLLMKSALIILDLTIIFFNRLSAIFSPYTLLHTSVSLTGCISIIHSVLNILIYLNTLWPVRSLLGGAPTV